VVHGVHTSPPAAKITVVGVPHAAASAAVFRIVAEQKVEPGLMSQHPADAATIAIAVPRSSGPPVLTALRAARTRIGFQRVDLEDDVVVLTLTGAGLRTDPTVPATFCEVLVRGGVRLGLVTIENGRISVVCGSFEVEFAVRTLCEALELGADHAIRGRAGLVRPAAR
jgi:aspartokinase